MIVVKDPIDMYLLSEYIRFFLQTTILDHHIRFWSLWWNWFNAVKNKIASVLIDFRLPKLFSPKVLLENWCPMMTNPPIQPIPSTFCSLSSRKAQNDYKRTRRTSDELKWTKTETQINNKTERQDRNTKERKIDKWHWTKMNIYELKWPSGRQKDKKRDKQNDKGTPPPFDLFFQFSFEDFEKKTLIFLDFFETIDIFVFLIFF